MGSVVVGDQRPLDWCIGGPVAPDAHGHGQQPLGDPGVQPPGGPAAVSFEVELALEGVVDRFDPLPDPADGAVPGCLVLAVGADQVQPVPGGDQVLELAFAERGQQMQPGLARRRPPDLDEHFELTARRTALLHQRVVQTARALRSAAADTAALLEQRADLLAQPGRIDYPTEIKRWQVIADEAAQMAERWEQRP